MRPRVLVPVLIVLIAAALGWQLYARLTDGDVSVKKAGNRELRPVPVEVAEIRRGAIELRRNFTGTLEAHAEFVVSPKIDGRIVHLEVDLGDSVSRDQTVAILDDAEHLQTVARARAELAVARANLQEARSLLVIADRELERINGLQAQGLSSVSQRDAAQADQLARDAHVQVTAAQVARAEAELEAARIRLGYTQVSAAWREGSDKRVVAERFVDEGETVSANAPLVRIVEVDPITTVFYVTERDYALLRPGQAVEIGTDAYPGEIFRGRISRISPVFRQDARQARVEVSVANPDIRLKPGMYARTRVVLDSASDTTIVPEQALATRDGKQGVFVVAEDGQTVTWRPVEVGIRQDGNVQVTGDGLIGRVVTLGQQLLDDGSSIVLAGRGTVTE